MRASRHGRRVALAGLLSLVVPGSAAVLILGGVSLAGFPLPAVIALSIPEFMLGFWAVLTALLDGHPRFGIYSVSLDAGYQLGFFLGMLGFWSALLLPAVAAWG